MNHPFGSPDPPRTLAERLARLNDNLQALGERLKASIASVVGEAIAEAVSDAVRRLLGGTEAPADPYRDHRERHGPTSYLDRGDDPWGEEDSRWEDDEVYAPAREAPAARNSAGSRWRDALCAAAQAALWFLKRLPRRRPFLTTLAVALAAGTTGFVAGPAVAAGAGVLVSVAGLLVTADTSQSVAELAAG
ncbi:MAG: hypothetical protein U0736_20635 [Gemmataceae bacterium]